MGIEITKPGKHVLEVNTPVMPAAGSFGFGGVYKDFVNFDKLGAIVTNPVSYDARHPATGTRVVPLNGGVLVHTGLPNPGLNRVLRRHRGEWKMLPLPVIVHLIATGEEHLRKCAARLDEEDTVAALEIGLDDDLTWQDAAAFVEAAASRTEKPLLVRLPLLNAGEFAQAVTDAGAGALVVSAPPRGTARDPYTGRLVSGRLYGPLVKPVVLRAVGQLARQVEIPIIGAGGIHTPQDARDYIEAGAVAVQVDSVTWIRPTMLETISRDLGGMIVTREAGALADEWHPGMGDTERDQQRKPLSGDRDAPAHDQR
jgi:dihydroorotate dehydrogenase (NAD+) catalytic subunit